VQLESEAKPLLWINYYSLCQPFPNGFIAIELMDDYTKVLYGIPIPGVEIKIPLLNSQSLCIKSMPLSHPSALCGRAAVISLNVDAASSNVS
jgi:hypothetical protein